MYGNNIVVRINVKEERWDITKIHMNSVLNKKKPIENNTADICNKESVQTAVPIIMS